MNRLTDRKYSENIKYQGNKFQEKLKIEFRGDNHEKN